MSVLFRSEKNLKINLLLILSVCHEKFVICGQVLLSEGVELRDILIRGPYLFPDERVIIY